MPTNNGSTKPSGDELKHRSGYRFVPWIFGFVAFVIAAKKLIGGYHDLGIYLDVAREFQQGGFDLCRAREHSGPWVYPPCAALPFVVLDAAFGNSGARWVWCVLMGVATALLLRALAQCLRPIGGLTWWQWAAFGLLFQRCIAQNLSHGQMSLWVGTLVAMGCANIVARRDRHAGVLLGIAAACKLTPLLFLIALPLMGRSRAMLAMLTTFLFCVFVLPWPFCGTDEHVRHLTDFYRTVCEAVLTPEQATITANSAGPNVRGTIDVLLQPRPVNEDGTTVNFADVSDTTLAVIRFAWSAAIGALLLWWFVVARTHGRERRLLEQCAIVTLGLTFFAPLVRLYHLAAMLLPAALFSRGPRDRRDWLWFSTCLVLLFTMTLRQRKLLGRDLWLWLDAGGLLHFALVAMTIWLLRESRRAATSNRPHTD